MKEVICSWVGRECLTPMMTKLCQKWYKIPENSFFNFIYIIYFQYFTPFKKNQAPKYEVDFF